MYGFVTEPLEKLVGAQPNELFSASLRVKTGGKYACQDLKGQTEYTFKEGKRENEKEKRRERKYTRLRSFRINKYKKVSSIKVITF